MLSQPVFPSLEIYGNWKNFYIYFNLDIVIHALISARLDWYAGVNQFSLSRLQLVQNAAARFLMGKKKSEHITPISTLLHWLSVKFRIDNKVLTFLLTALHSLAPASISDLYLYILSTKIS